MMTSKQFLLWLLILLMKLTGCSQSQMPIEPTPPTIFQPAVLLPTPPDQITIGLTNDITSLDPHLITDTFSRVVLDNIYDTLVYRTADLALTPGLALSWQALDLTTWEVKLRPNVYFHNGEPFTAADVKFTLERPLQDPQKFTATYNRFAVIEEVLILDDTTVHIKTHEPYPLMAARLSEWHILSHTYVAQIGSDALHDHANGTGAYRLVEWQPNEQIRLQANPNHWGGEPTILQAVFLPLPNLNDRLFALIINRADIITDLPLNYQTELVKYPNLTYRLEPSTYIQYIALDGTKNPILADVRVRQALQYATNVPALVEEVFAGAARPIPIPIAPNTFGYDASIPFYGYNPQRARELLAEAGYPDGFRMVLDAPVGRYPGDQQTVALIAEQWAAVGVQLEVIYNDWPTQLAKYRSPEAQEMAEAHFMGWGTSTFDADDILYNAFAVQPNRSHYTNPEVTRLVMSAHTTMSQSERLGYYQQALRIIHAEVPWIFLFQQYDIYGVNRRVQWQPRSDQRLILREIVLLPTSAADP